MDVFASARVAAWSRVPALIDEYLEKTAAPAWDIQRAVAGVYTHGDVGVYWHPHRQVPGCYWRLGGLGVEKCSGDLARVRMAVVRATGQEPEPLSKQLLFNTPWVKVAYSPFLRRSGELLNFYPGEYPGGIPNAPSPLAATLTSGLVGAGLGYGAGALGESVLPHSWRRGKLRKTLAMLGAGALATPGALWMYSAHQRGLPLASGPLENDVPRPDQPGFPEPIELPHYPTYTDLGAPEPGSRYNAAVEDHVKQSWDEADPTGVTPEAFDVHIDRLGRTLWDVGADPRVTGSTMGAIYAAQQMPDPNAQPGVVTPNQTGLLGQMLGGGAKGYATGWLAGRALGLLTGMPPETQNVLKHTGAALGIIDAIVPRLLGH